EVRGVAVDFGRFGGGGVVFPQHEHRIRIFGKLWIQRQRSSGFVDSHGRGAGGIYGNALNVLCYRGAGLLHAIANGSFQALEVIERVLSELILVGPAVFSVTPSRIVKYRGSNLRPVGGIDYYRPYRIRSEVDSDDKRRHSLNPGLVIGA